MNQTRKKIELDNVELIKQIESKGTETYSYRELMMMYNCAILEIRTKLDVLSTEFTVKSRNPIEFIKTRIKKPKSILEKLQRKGFELSVESMQKNLHDIAGVRVVCSFVEDIYEVARMLTRQDDIKVVEVEDYIKNPKPNGYRSLHMIIEVPVFLSDCKRYMKVEIQIRTIAMDFWASLEHEIRYKKVQNVGDDIVDELKECADVIYQTDIHMQNIKKRLALLKEEEGE